MYKRQHLIAGQAGLLLNVLLVHLLGHGVVDVQQRDALAGDALGDEFGQRAVNIHLAGHRDAAARQAGIDIAGHKAERLLERRPAFARDGEVFAHAAVVFDPIQQGDLIPVSYTHLTST